MILPNKFITYNQSIIYKMLFILKVDEDKIGLHSLYEKLENKFDNIDEFLYSLDLLYILDLINVDFKSGVVSYVNRD